MSMIRKCTLAAGAVAVIAGSGLSTISTASAMTGLRVAPVESTAVAATEVGFKKHRKHFRKHYYGYYPHCFWKPKKFWDPYYGYYWKKIHVCY